jgi:hypothetical protein
LHEVCVFRLHVWIEAGGDEGRHVERLADVGATASNKAGEFGMSIARFDILASAFALALSSARGGGA